MSKNDITGDSLRSRELSPEGKANWDLIFPPTRKGVCPTCNDDGRACAYPSESKPGCLHVPWNLVPEPATMNFAKGNAWREYHGDLFSDPEQLSLF